MLKEIVISNFDLIYDGTYCIKWESFKERVFLELKTILKMLEIEGYTSKDVEEQTEGWEPLRFSKVELIIKADVEDGIINWFYTSDFSDSFPGLTLIDAVLK
jgi:hypothetical protein